MASEQIAMLAADHGIGVSEITAPDLADGFRGFVLYDEQAPYWDIPDGAGDRIWAAPYYVLLEDLRGSRLTSCYRLYQRRGVLGVP
jgi:hypothetical protein